MIDKLAWLHLQHKHILSTKSFGKDKYYIPGSKREPGETDDIEQIVSKQKLHRNSEDFL